jgi:hypothetical protein
MKPRVLWVEDSARLELRNLTGPVYFSGKYDFNMAEDVTTAVNFLKSKAFDAVIVDIRLPPGIDSSWRTLYQRASSDKVQAQLGLKLLYWLLGHNRRLYASAPPDWIKPEQIGVFTVESKQEIQPELSKLRISLFQQKVAGLRDTVLLDLIEQVLDQSGQLAVNV